MRLTPPWYALPKPTASISPVTIIGGGLAGMSLAYHLTLSGINVTIYDQSGHLPNQASSNQTALIKPQLSPDLNLPDQYFTSAFLEFSQFIQAYPELILSQGILELAHSEKVLIRQQGILKKRALGALVVGVSALEASAIAGVPLMHPGLYFKNAFLLDVPRYYQLLQKLCGERLQVVVNTKVEHIDKKKGAIVFAHGYQGFEQYLDTDTLWPCPGQLSFIKPTMPMQLRCTLSFDGYLTPLLQGQHILGASFRHQEQLDIIDKEHQQQLSSLSNITPELAQVLAHAPWQGWCAMRTTSPDHLPLIGGVPIKTQWFQDFERIKFGDFRKKIYPPCPYYPNLYMSLAHGSKGVLSSFYAGKILAALIAHEEVIVSSQVWSAIHPARFWLRDLKRAQ